MAQYSANGRQVMNKISALRTAFRLLPIPGVVANKLILPFTGQLNRLEPPESVRCQYGLSVEVRSLGDLIQRQLYFQGYFEYRETRLITSILRPGMCVLDVGANIGWHTLLAAKCVGEAGRVISFEPVRSTFEHLQRNIALNNLTNVTALNCGLSADSGIREIYAVEQGNDGANSLFRRGPFDAKADSVTLVRGSELALLQGLQQVDFCKIDVEGAEMDVLEGLGDVFLQGRIKHLLIELNEEALGAAGRSGKELVSLLATSGYFVRDVKTKRSLNAQSNLPSQSNLFCTRP